MYVNMPIRIDILMLDIEDNIESRVMTSFIIVAAGKNFSFISPNIISNHSKMPIIGSTKYSIGITILLNHTYFIMDSFVIMILKLVYSYPFSLFMALNMSIIVQIVAADSKDITFIKVNLVTMFLI